MKCSGSARQVFHKLELDKIEKMRLELEFELRSIIKIIRAFELELV